MSERTKIVIKAGSKGHMILKEMIARKDQFKADFNKSMPPKYIRDFIKEKSRQTKELNKSSNFNEESFRLGMYALWFHLYKLDLLNKKQEDKRIKNTQDGT